MKHILTLLGILVLAASAAVAGPLDPVLDLLPAGNITGAPGSTIGWGYEIINNSTSWYLPVSVSAPVFVDGVPTLIFDYPSVGPGATVIQPYTGTLGFLQLALFSSATVGHIDQGTVILSGEYFSGDPYTDPNATDLGAAPDARTALSATVVPGTTQIPEPSYRWILAAGLGLAALRGGTLRGYGRG